MSTRFPGKQVGWDVHGYASGLVSPTFVVEAVGRGLAMMGIAGLYHGLYVEYERDDFERDGFLDRMICVDWSL